MDPDSGFTEYAATRWGALVRAGVLLGCAVPEAEDLAQQTLLRCYVKWGRVERAADRNAYVARIQLNLLRQSRRRRWWGERATGVLPERATADDTARVDDADALTRALHRLPEVQREAVVLRHYPPPQRTAGRRGHRGPPRDGQEPALPGAGRACRQPRPRGAAGRTTMSHQTLSELLDRSIEHVPDTEPPLADLLRRGRAARSRRRRTAVVGAAIASVLVVGSVAAGQRLPPGADPAVGPPSSLPAPPSGMQWGGVGRTVVAVPEAWPVVPGIYCQGPTEPYVTITQWQVVWAVRRC